MKGYTSLKLLVKSYQLMAVGEQINH